MADYELKSAVNKIRDKRFNFAFYRGEDADQVLITSKPPAAKQVSDLEKECGDSKRLMKGVCFWETGTLVFATKNTPAPAWEMMITKVFKDRKCSQFLPINLRQLGANESEEVSFEESSQALPGQTFPPPAPATQTTPGSPQEKGAASQPPPGSAPVPPAPPAPPQTPQSANGDLKAQWEKYKASLMPQLRVAIAAPATKETVTKIVTAAIAKEKAGAYADAILIFQKLAGALKLPAVAPSPAPVAPVEKAPPPPPPPPVKPPKPGNLQAAMNKLTPAIKAALRAAPDRKAEILGPIAEFQRQLDAGQIEEARETLRKLGNTLKTLLASGSSNGASSVKPAQGAKVLFAQSRLRWNEARNQVQTELQKLEQSILEAAKDEPHISEIAQKTKDIYNILGVLDESLIDKLDEAYNSAEPQGLRKAQDEAVEIIKRYTAFVNGDPLMAAIDHNPFGTFDVKGRMSGVLADLSTKLSQEIPAPAPQTESPK